VDWLSGNVVGHINEVTSMTSSASTGMGDRSRVCNQPLRPTQPTDFSGTGNDCSLPAKGSACGMEGNRRSGVARP